MPAPARSARRSTTTRSFRCARRTASYTLMGQNSPSSILQRDEHRRTRCRWRTTSPTSSATRACSPTPRASTTSSHGLKFRVSLGADLSNRDARHLLPAHDAAWARRSTARPCAAQTQTTNFLNENTLSYNHAFGATHASTRSSGTRASRATSRTARSEQQLRQRHRRVRVDRQRHADRRAAGQLGPHALDARVVPRPHQLHARSTATCSRSRAAKTARRASAPITSGASSRRRRSAGACPTSRSWRSSPPIELLKFRVVVPASPATRRSARISRWRTCCRSSTRSAARSSRATTRRRSATRTSAGNRRSRLDYGVDLGLYGGRVSLTGDIYRKKTDDLLLAVNLPFESGFATRAAERGIGAATTATSSGSRSRCSTTKTNSLGWTTTFNYSHNKNKVLDLGGVKQIFANSVNSDLKLLGSADSGRPAARRVLRIQDGRLAARLGVGRGIHRAVKPLTGTSWNPGDVKLLDIAGVDPIGSHGTPDGKIDANDRTIIGDPNPKFTAGWMNTFIVRRASASAR